MNLNFIKYFLYSIIFNLIIVIPINAKKHVNNGTNLENKLLSFPNDHQINSWHRFDKEMKFKSIKSDNNNAWKLGDYRIKCRNINYTCNLNYLNQNLSFSIPSDIDNINGLNVYLYRSTTNKLYNIILLEAEEERGIGWYYVLVLNKTNLVGQFFINQGRSGIYLIDEGKKFTCDNKAINNESLPRINHSICSENIDEIYISPKYFLSIFNKNNEFLFMFNKVYANEQEEENDTVTYITEKNIYIEKKIN
ncbi:hypothetical protein [uncultured Gilliamella sp.]|uniref:hypothetical protein n=1 Tax=uncultured Gilliamella sp. TaxID=1193505 RepID=UPI0025EE662E|nr:hypothetical protein [uncultured Gilliamella sp.]